MSRGKLYLTIFLVLVVIALGTFFLRTPQPVIVLAPEVIFSTSLIDITNTMITAWIITILLVVISLLATRNVKLVPSGLQNLFEAVVEAFYGLVKSIAGEQKARIFLPVTATIFFFIAFSNWAGLLPIFNSIGKFVGPEHVLVEELEKDEEGDVELTLFDSSGINLVGFNADTVEIEFTETEATFDDTAGEEVALQFEEGATEHEKAEEIEHALEAAGYDPDKTGHLLPIFRSVNTDLTVPLAMSLVSFFFVEYWAFRALGFGYLKKFFNVSSPIAFFVGILELLSELIRIVSLTFRLFGNTLAGEVLLIMVVFLTPLLVVELFYGLELMFAVIQAFIFAILTVVFATMATEGHGDEHGEKHT
ncbi:MAG: F0F1 ATP synthase subunit A [Dehalococcoidia bacterium]